MTMTHDEGAKLLRAKNIRTALWVAGLALALFISIIVRVWTLA